MSATIDTQMFTEYFGNCPIVEIEGRSFPVQGNITSLFCLCSNQFYYQISVARMWMQEGLLRLCVRPNISITHAKEYKSTTVH